MFEHFDVILWIYTQNRSHRSGTTLLLRQREAAGFKDTPVLLGSNSFYNLGLQEEVLELGFSQDRAKCSIPDCIILLGVPFSLFYLTLLHFHPLWWRCSDLLYSKALALGYFPLLCPLVCCLIPGVTCWFLGLVSSTGIALSPAGEDGLAFCSALASCVQFRVRELWFLAVFMCSHNGESLE